MGAYLDTPVKDKNPDPGFNEICSWGACAMQGWRTGMEDAHIAEEIMLPDGKKGMIFGVFDGHGGKEVAIFAQTHFTRILKSQPEFKAKSYDKALIKAFLKLDSDVSKEEYAVDTGTTSCVVLVTSDMIICANAGDSRGVLKCAGKAIALSEDHKPDNTLEQQRIEKAHHMVEDQRVDGNLALSRAFGDFQYKDQNNLKPEDQAVTALPDISVRNRTKQD